jgi:hypothetical protein
MRQLPRLSCRKCNALHPDRGPPSDSGISCRPSCRRPHKPSCHTGVDRRQIRGTWELPAIGAVTAPTAALVRPDGYVGWVGELTQVGLADALTTWFGPATVA